MTRRRPGSHSGLEDGDTRAHNTLSAETTYVQVLYPFHPLNGKTLRVICRPKGSDGAVTVMEPSGSRLKIPIWMLSPDCAAIEVEDKARLGKEALLNLASLLATVLSSADSDHDNLLQIALDRSNGGQRGSTATSRPKGRKARGASPDGRKGAARANRSNG
jgi:hypothetical protein